MCLILFAYKVHPDYKLIVAANRDEFYKRPTAPAHYWEDHPEILAGRDLEKMGTWMGITRNGRFAALTNYRNPQEQADGKHSRGELVANALLYEGNMKEYMEKLSENKEQYPGYNLLAGDIDELYYFSNIGGELQKLEPGLYGVSNHLLNTDWPKVIKGKERLSKLMNGNLEGLIDELFTLLQTSDPVADEQLPKTGVSLEMERMLSPLFISSEHYGTRSSTILLMTNTGIQYIERTFTSDSTKEQQFKIQI
ncbi:NRDE family protein [Neobacillus niacini]|nr:NRDE family protein [Neobacillus niacini]